MAIDGSAASIDQSLSRKPVTRDRAEIEEKVREYLDRLDIADEEDSQIELERDRVVRALETLHRRSQRLARFEQGLEEPAQTSYSVDRSQDFAHFRMLHGEVVELRVLID